jgi:ribosome-binding protein aMBF1 (putative translation factor)
MSLDLREARLKLGIKQVELAKRTGIDRSVLSLIENGWKSPNQEQRTKIEAVLGSQVFRHALNSEQE